MAVDSQEVATRARCRLKERLYSGVRTVSCEYDRGMLFLRGRAVSYYHKQLAQEAVARVEGVAQVINEIDVVDLSR